MSLLACLFAARVALSAAPDLHAPRFAAAERPDVITGRVVDAADEPVASARVRAVAPARTGYQGLFDAEPGETVIEVASDEHGRFTLDPRARRSRELWIETGDGRVGHAELVAAGEDVTVRVVRPATITVELVGAGGTTLPGVAVAASWTQTALVRQFTTVRHTLASAVTDDTGRAVLDRLPPGPVEIAWDLAATDTKAARPWRVLAGEASTLRLKASEPLVWIQGRVVDRGGHPLAHARISLGVHGGSVASCDADGRFDARVFAPEGGRQVCVSAENFALELRPLLDLAPASKPVDIVLGPGRSVRGRLVDETGAPLADVPVVAVNDPFVSEADRVRGLCDVDGTFRLHGLRADVKHVLVAHSPGRALLVRSLGDAEFGAPDLDLGVLAFAPGITLTGVFLAMDGQPMPHAEVSCAVMPPRRENDSTPSTTQPLDMPIGSLRTDALGRFRFDELPEGLVTITGLAQNTMKRESLAISAKSPRAEIVVRAITPLRAPDLSKSEVGGRIVGRVVRSDGATPAPRTRVEILPEDDTASPVRETFTDELGEFTVTELQGARYRLVLQLRDGFLDSAPVRARARATPEEFAAWVNSSEGPRARPFRLREVVTVTGRVVDARTEQQRPWLVRAVPLGDLGVPACVGSDDDGRFTFEMEQGATMKLGFTPLLRDPGRPRSAAELDLPAAFVVDAVRVDPEELTIHVP